jgi:hypothetical protein
MRTGGSFPEDKAAGYEADQLVPRSRKHETVHPHPHTPSWRSAQLVKYRKKERKKERTLSLPSVFKTLIRKKRLPVHLVRIRGWPQKLALAPRSLKIYCAFQFILQEE